MSEGGRERRRERGSGRREGEERYHPAPLERFQSTALRATFSSGSPTSSPSSRTKEWHVARTHWVSNGDSRAGIRPCLSAVLGLREMETHTHAPKEKYISVMPYISNTKAAANSFSDSPLNSSNTFNDKIVARQGARLIKTTYVHFSSKRNTKRLCTIDT